MVKKSISVKDLSEYFEKINSGDFSAALPVKEETVNNILPESDAMPIVKKWISNAVKTIYIATGETIEDDYILSRLTDCDWIICGGYTENNEFLVDMEAAKRTLDNIVKHEIKYINDEKSAELESALTRIDKNIWECSGLWIEFNCYGNNEYSVQFCGDDLLFDSLEAAADFCREQN